MNIKIVSLTDQILLLLQLGDGDISRLTSSHPFALLTHVNFLSGSRVLQKMEVNLVG